MSRIAYQDGKLYLSLTREEVEKAQKNIGVPLELPIGQLKVFQEDINKAVMAYWSKVGVYEAIEEHQLSYNRKSKRKK